MRLFLSYSRQDADFARFLRALVARAAPEADLWMDDRLDAGAPYPGTIQSQVRACDMFLAAASPRWRDSSWCQRELDWARARGAAVEIVPLIIEQVDLADTGLAAFQAIDMQRWRIDGDRVLRARWLRSLGAPSTLAATAPGVHESMREVVLWAARTRTPDEVGRHLLDAATWQVATDPTAALPRARLLDAIAGLHLTRREWSEMRSATHAALELVREAGWPNPRYDASESGQLSDDDLGFLGELHTRLALGSRQIGDQAGVEHAYAALAVYGRIQEPLLRNEKSAQVHRELGTWAQERGDDQAAREHFRTSARLLEDLPSQRFHLYQARIKEAQVELARGDVQAAGALIESVAAHFAPDSPLEAHLAHQVLPHFLLTEAAWAALAGLDDRARTALSRHAEARSKGSGGRNHLRRAAISSLLALPTTMRLAAVRTALLAR